MAVTFLRTKRPFIAVPNQQYSYNIPLKNVAVTEDAFVGDIASEDRFYCPNKVGIIPRGIAYPKYAWEKYK